MKLNDLVYILGKTREEVNKMLKENEIIELNLTEKEDRKMKESGEIKIMQ